MPFWNCIIVVTETLFHTLKRRNFPSFLKRFTLGNVIEFYENHERFFLKKHWLAVSWWHLEFLYKQWNFDNIPGTEQKQKLILLTLTVFALSFEVNAFIISAALLLSSQKLWYQTVVLANHHPSYSLQHHSLYADSFYSNSKFCQISALPWRHDTLGCEPSNFSFRL